MKYKNFKSKQTFLEDTKGVIEAVKRRMTDNTKEKGQTITQTSKDQSTRTPLINGDQLRRGKRCLFHMVIVHYYPTGS